MKQKYNNPCLPTQKTMVGGLATSKPSYDVSKHIEYIVGINDKDFFEARQDPKMVFRAVKVHIRHEEFECHKMFSAKTAARYAFFTLKNAYLISQK